MIVITPLSVFSRLAQRTNALPEEPTERCVVIVMSKWSATSENAAAI